jgi:hypothetical protein
VVWSHFGPFLESAQSFSAGQVWFRQTLFDPSFILCFLYIIIVFYYYIIYIIILVSIWKGLLIGDQLLFHEYAPLNPIPWKLRIMKLRSIHKHIKIMCWTYMPGVPAQGRDHTYRSKDKDLGFNMPWVLRHHVTNVNHIETICRTFFVILLIPPKKKMLVFANGICKWVL